MSARHVIGRQRFEVEVGSEQTAVALQPLLGTYNRRRWLPAVERVLDEIDAVRRSDDEGPGRLRIDRLELDLGTVSLSRLEEDVEAGLSRALRRALERALGRSGTTADGVRRLSEAGARRELVEWELTTGTLPYWGRSAGSVPLEERVVALMAEDPEGLVTLVREQGRRSRRVLERLARQLGDAALAELIRLLDPEHAALILAYVEDLRGAHRAERLVSRSPRDFSFTLWVLVQAYLVEEAGSHFNRKSFVRSLLRRLAIREGVSETALLALLARGLERLTARRPVRSSLPAVIAELLSDARREGWDDPAAGSEAAEGEGEPAGGGLSAASERLFARYRRLDLLRELLRAEEVVWHVARSESADAVEAVFRDLASGSGAGLRDVLRSLAGERLRHAVDRLAGLVPVENLRRRLHQVVPATADPDHPLHLAVETFAGRADHPSVFYADLLAAGLRGEGLDLEAAAARASRSREASAGAAAGRGSANPPTEAPLWRAVWSALREIPVPYRPRPEHLLEQMLAVGSGRTGARADRPWTEDAFEALLAGLFTWPLPEPVGRFLLARAETWSEAGGRHRDHGAAFRAALLAAGAGDPGEAEGASGRIPEENPREAAGASRVQAETAAFVAWLEGAGPAPPRTVTRRVLDALLRRRPREVIELLRRRGADPRQRRRWVEALPEADLARVTTLLAPARHRELLAAAEVLAAAWVEAQGSGPPTFGDRRVFWGFVLGFLTRPSSGHGTRRGSGEGSVEGLATAFFKHCAERFRVGSGAGPERAGEVGSSLLTAAEKAAHRSGQAVLRAVLLQERQSLLAVWAAETTPGRPRPSRRSVRSGDPEPHRAGRDDRDDRAADRWPAGEATGGTDGEPGSRPDAADDSLGDPLYLDNAGLVLAGPFLPHLFGALDLLEDWEGKQRLRGPVAASRAVHLLQWLVDGTTDTPEPRLVLNKILCGLPLEIPVEASVELTRDELDTGRKLLDSLLANWSALSGTSVAGLRETFLQREGRLDRTAEGWRLTVQRKTLDVLVDQVPWGFSVLLQRWMSQPVYVNW